MITPFWLLLLACAPDETGSRSPSDADADTDTDTDSDADADTDTPETGSTATGDTGPVGPCDYETVDGIAIVDAEDLPLVGDWTLGDDAEFSGYHGTGYVFWDGPQYLGDATNGLMSLTLRFHAAGRYELRWRNQVGLGTSTTDHNDTWVRMTGVADFFGVKGPSTAEERVYPEPQCSDDAFVKAIEALPNVATVGCVEGSSTDGFLKVYSSGASDWSWSTRTNDNDGHVVVIELDAPGDVTFELAARSSFHLIDRLVWHDVGVGDGEAEDLDRPNTACTP
ncbi:MAG: hypothetical protein KTR31_26425 [Myxococcales bacterium]|nr:hypothetical protein [Myxococcales bacterium]